MKNETQVRSSAIGIFTEIARENYQRILEIESPRKEIKERLARSETNDEKLFSEYELIKLESKANKCVSIVIVFSAIAIEAYIYDFAARNLSDAFVKNYLDKLDPISKWVIIPHLITGKELPRDHRWFELLNKLFQQRNRIVHQKPSSPTVNEDMISYFKKLQENSDQTYATVREAIELLDILPNEMREIDPGEIVWISSYLAPNPDNLFIP